jgi:tetratricopeptide (TPR) repeat protein
MQEDLGRNALGRTLFVIAFVGCLAASLIGILCYVVVPGSDHDGWRIAGTSLLVATAAFLFGGLLGLIFGIPRLPPVDSTSSGTAVIPLTGARGIRYQDNNSLEKISDWLTTLLVGAGLTQLSSLPRLFRKAALYLAPAMGTFAGREAYAFSLIVLFLLLGFFTVYLLSRLFLPDYLSDTYIPCLAMKVAAGISFPERDGPKAVVASQIAPDARQLRSIPMSQLRTAGELGAWAKAHAAVDNYTAAETAYREALNLEPDNNEIAFELAEVLLAQEKYKDAIDALERLSKRLDATTEREKARLVQRELLYGYLFLAPPTGFENAIRIGEQYVSDDQAHPRAWALLACAYGQQFSWSQQRNAPDLAASRANALRCVQEVKNLGSSNWLNALRRAWQGASPDENDLVAFRKDPDFVRLFSAE